MKNVNKINIEPRVKDSPCARCTKRSYRNFGFSKDLCSSCYMKEYRGPAKERIKGLSVTDKKRYQKQYTLKRKYNITLEQYEILLNNSNGKCDLCSKIFTEIPHLDHDHKTKKVRGLLCNNCNLGLGLFKDDENILHKAIKYLMNNR